MQDPELMRMARSATRVGWALGVTMFVGLAAEVAVVGLFVVFVWQSLT